MATVIGHQLLFTTNLKYFKAIQLISGKSIFDRYRISKPNIIDKEINEAYQHFLAFPYKDNDTLEFHGVISTDDIPMVLSELEENKKIKYQKIKEETISHFQDKIEKLKKSGKDIEASFLGSAIKYIDDRFVFCYDNKVVLGAWGMQLRDNISEDINVIRIGVPSSKKNTADNTPPSPPESKPTYTVRFNVGDYGSLEGYTELSKLGGESIFESEIPTIVPHDNYEFIGWDDDPYIYQVYEDKQFNAQYNQVSPPYIPIVPWYKQFWNWLIALFTGKGCLKWLLRALIFLLLLFLLLFLLRNCHSCGEKSIDGGLAIGDNDRAWLLDDPNRGYNGGIYDPHKPYDPVKTPPGYADILPPHQGLLPPFDDDVEVIPGNPSIIANRLNILMENKDKSILDLAKEFKNKYPDKEYKVVYYDDVVKRMQIEIPPSERESLKKSIPGDFAPEYELFVFDEALFEGVYTPNDPVFSNPENSWHFKAINAQQAWDITQGSEKITIAIVDNGFNLKHYELKRKVVQPYNVWTHSQDVFPQQIDHGTHIAGIALATSDNGKGISGIAPNCKFMPIQVADKRGIMTTTSVLDGILFALYQGADVVNVSLGTQFTGLSMFSEEVQNNLINNHFKEEERLWREVMRIAAKHNSTIVTAAGNDNVLAGIDALQRPELFITVSATGKNNQRIKKANFSNYGSYSTVSAPGVEIYSTVGQKDYSSMDGTSMAAPIVAGTVALMKSLNDTITTKQIICILQKTGIDVNGNVGRLVQLDKALEKVKSGQIMDCTPAPSTGDVQILLSWDNYNDLDLICTDPDGNTIWYKNTRVSNGGQLEIDMNVEYPDSNKPIENIYWPMGMASQGKYNVYILLYQNHINTQDNPYMLKIKYGDKEEIHQGVISKEGDPIHIANFIVGNNDIDNPTPQNPNIPVEDNRRMELEREREHLQNELNRVENELRQLANNR